MAEVESLELQIKGNASGATKSINNLIKTLDKLEQATAGGCGLSAVTKEMGKLKNINIGLSSSNNSSSKSFANLATKAAAAVLTLKKVGSTVALWIKESNEYVENLNLFTVAMGEYAGEAKKYAEQVGEAMGIDPSEWMRSQGVLMTLATGFGVAGDRANTMSQQLTQLGYDLSSFYNVSVEEAMSKLKSGFAGELEPLRSWGYDLSQAKLEAVALSLGIDKSVSSMTQAEKAQLRYYAIMTQVTTAHGDMARTLNDPANQLRVLRAQLDQAARALGDLFIPMLKAVLPYLIAATKVVRILANAIGGLFGVVSETDESGLGNLGSSAGDASDALGEAADNAVKLRKTLLGIDELNVLSDASSSGSGGGSGSEFDFKLPTMENWLNTEVGKQIDEIVEKMKKWLGITEDITSWSDFFDTRLGSILKLVGLIGVGMAAWKVTKGTLDVIAAIKALLASPTYSIAIGVILTITGVTIAFEGLEDAVRRGLDGFNFAEIIGGGLLTGGGAALLGTKIARWIMTAFAGSTVSNALTTAAINLLGTTTGPITASAVAAAGGVLLAAVAGIILGIPTAIVGIRDALINGIDWLSGILIPAGSTAAAAGIGAIIGACGGPLTAGIGALIGLAVGLVTDGIILITQKGGEIVQWFDDIRGKFDGWASDIRGKISGFFDGIVGQTKGFSPLLAHVFELMGIDVLYVFDDIKAGVDNFLTRIRNLVDTLSKLFNGDFAGAFAGLKTMISNDLRAIGNTWARSLNAMIAKFESMVNFVIRGINKMISGINSIYFEVPEWVPGIGGQSVGFDIESVSEVKLGRVSEYAGGGYPTQGQMFIANEAGPELVGTIGNRSAVVNNDQIVSAVSKGVYQAVVQAMGQSGGNQVVEAKVNDKVLFEVVVNRNRQETMRTGYSPLLGGA
jgi:hypothetical protein